jgi:hypothetical protein
MTHPDVLDAILTLAQRLNDGVDAVTDHAKAVRRPQEIRVSTMISAVVRSGENSGDGWGPMPAEYSESTDGFEARACVAVAPALAATIPAPVI